MPYFLLVTGAIISCCALIALRRGRKNSIKTAMPFSFPSAAAENSALDIQSAGLIYELKERVEERLADMDKQKEAAAFLLLKLENKLAELEYLGQERKNTESMSQNADGLSAHNQERARLQKEIFTLFEQGMNVAEISRIVGKGKGEVRLILNLKKT